CGGRRVSGNNPFTAAPRMAAGSLDAELSPRGERPGGAEGLIECRGTPPLPGVARHEDEEVVRIEHARRVVARRLGAVGEGELPSGTLVDLKGNRRGVRAVEGEEPEASDRDIAQTVELGSRQLDGVVRAVGR